MPGGPGPGLVQVVDRPVDDAGLLEVARQPDRDLLGVVAVQGLERGGHVLVEPDPLDLVERAVQVALEEHVGEAEQRQPAGGERTDPPGTHQPVAGLQLPAEPADGLPGVGVLHPRHHLGTEVLALDAGDGQQLPQLVGEALDAGADHPLHPLRQRGPVEAFGLDPPPLGVADEHPPVLHGAQRSPP